VFFEQRKIMKSQRISFFTFLIISLSLILCKTSQVNKYPDFFSQSHVISYDVYGYYLHLPATLIYKDPGIEKRDWFDSLNTKYHKGIPVYQVSAGINNRLANVYPVGIALLWSPFFLIAHSYAKIAGYPPDGLSAPYQVMIVIAGMFYAVLGVYLLRKLLLKFATDKITAWVMFCICIGTNFFFYGAYDSAMPHILIFPLDILIVLLTISWHESPARFKALLLGLTLSLATICRPTEFVWILVPIFWGIFNKQDLSNKIKLLQKNATHFLFFSFGLIVLGAVQIIYWQFTTGKWVSNNHSEGFDFFHPFVIETIFSYKKGWLLYTPMMAICIISILLLFKWSKNMAIPILVFFIINLWVLSSWECWWYGASFGQRAFVQSYGLMAIPLAVMYDKLSNRKWMTLSLTIILSVCVIFNQFQIRQFTIGVIDPFLMTKEYYWKVFGQLYVEPQDKFLLEVNHINQPDLKLLAETYLPKKVLSVDFETNRFIQEGQLICDTSGMQSNKSQIRDSNRAYSVKYELPFENITNRDQIILKMECDVLLIDSLNVDEVYFVCAMTGARIQTYGYMSKSILNNSLEVNKWAHTSAYFLTREILHQEDVLTCYVWNNGGKTVLLDNLEITVFEKAQK
jgi:hypothetical protein